MVTPPVIVTRAEPGAAETTARLKTAGYTALPSPVLELSALTDTRLDVDHFHQVIFTSANGVRFFCAATTQRDKLAWCVGPSTADAARAAGFQTVREGKGNAEQLAELILSDPASAQSPLLHVANDAAAGRLVEALNTGGRQAEFCALYTARPAKALTAEANAALTGQQLVIILIHSAKGAAALRQLLPVNGLKNVIIIAISDAAASPLKGQGARAIIMAAAPNETALFNAIDTACLSL